MESRRMTIFEHLEELRQRLFWPFAAFLISFTVFITFTIRFALVGGVAVPYLWPDFFNSISVQIVRFSLDWYLPAFVEPVQITPAEAIVVQFKVAMFLAILTAMPVIVYQLSRFVAPGLYPREKEIIAKITIPATLLFLAGVLVSHFLILPFIFDFLYTVGLNIGLLPLARPDAVFDIVLLFFLGMGLAFQIPVIMWGLAALGVINPEVWKKYWRIALLAFFFFGAVITPDGSGITMMLVAGPMTALYAVGYVLARRAWLRDEGPRERTGRPSTALWSATILLVAALIGAFFYFGGPAFLSPPPARTPLASGVVNVTLPAFVLYSAAPLSPLMSSGATLTANGKAEITYLWSGTASDGTPVDIAVNSTLALPFNASLDGPRLGVFPARWTAANVDAIRLAVGSGDYGVYVLNLSLAYTVFEVGDRLLLAYEPTPTSAAFLPGEASTVGPPSPTERILLQRGRFSTVGQGADWELAASIQGLSPANTTFTHASPRAVLSVDGRDVTIIASRTFTWSPAESHEVWVRGTGSADLVYLWYLDTRFGSIYPVLEAP